MSKNHTQLDPLYLEGKTALITGAGSGFGAAIAKQLAKAGANVALADINLKHAESVAKDIGTSAIAIQADVTCKDDIENMVMKTIENFEKIDIFVANAGFAHQQNDVTNIDEHVFDLMFAVNMKSLYFSVKAIIPHMRENGSGSIITLGAIMAERPQKGFSWFGAAKGWVMSATRALALELAQDNIRVNCISPIHSDASNFDHFYADGGSKKRQELIASIPLGRLSTAQDVANAALWLASNQSAFTTGAILPIDGGYSL